MAQEDKKLTDSFNSAQETDVLLKKTNEFIRLLEDSLKNVTSPMIELPLVSDKRVLGLCREIVKNQQRQDKKIAELEKRLADLEDGGQIVKLDKPNPPPPSPDSSK
jgi:hypothetical protein